MVCYFIWKISSVGCDLNFLNGVSCPSVLGAKLFADKQSRKVMGTAFLGVPVVKKHRSSMVMSRGSTSFPFPSGGSPARSLTDPSNAIDWTSSNLCTLMDPVEVATSASVPSKGGGSCPLIPDVLFSSGEEVYVGSAKETVLRIQDAHLEGEGESSPSQRPFVIPHLSLGSCFLLFLSCPFALLVVVPLFMSFI